MTQSIHTNCELAQTDDDTLAVVLHHLANAPDCSVAVQYEEIKKLDMVDLRPLLASGRYADAAHSVRERISSGRSTPAVSDGDRNGLWFFPAEIGTNGAHPAIFGAPEAIQKLVQAGVKEAFATEVVENSGTKPIKIIENPSRVIGEYQLEEGRRILGR